MALRKLVIDGIEIEVDPALTLIQACEVAGIEIPRFCYHERLSIAGNCRMCLVEPVGAPKPAASCHMQVRDLRGGPNGEPAQVRTNSPMVKKAREGVMEFLLINHPLDCPICDQGGECDLQDQAMAYGVDFSRYREPKRAAIDIHLGPLVETHMTRCISCTRCVRFITEVAGVPEMGQTGRGEDSEIVSYLDAALTSELQGNVVDLCPVGALTNKPYSFTARPWELKKTESIDVMDALGSNIRIDTRGREVMRFLPRNNDAVNEEWLADRSRYVWDGLRRQRLDKPYIREGGRLRPATWAEAFGVIAARAKGATLAAVAGDLVPVEAMWALKTLMARLGSDLIECRQDGAMLPPGNRSAWLFNAGVAALERAPAVLIVGSNPRLESPVLNARIRKGWVAGTEVAVIGDATDLTYPVTHLGHRLSDLGAWGDRLAGGMVILGVGAVAQTPGLLGATMSLAARVGASFNLLHTAAARPGGLAIGFAHDRGLGVLDGAGVVYNLGADEIDIAPGPLVIYHGSHGDRGAARADVILPGAAYPEQSGLFVNTEGRVQMADRAGFPPGEAKEDWAILRALSSALGAELPWNSLAGLRSDLFAALPEMGALGQRLEGPMLVEPGEADLVPATATEHYLVNPIARASTVLAELSRAALSRRMSMAAE